MPLFCSVYERGIVMPQVRKLAPEEVQALQNKGKGQRKLVEEEYDAILSEYEVGDYGEATLEPEENRLTVRNRLRAAAGRRGVGIEFRRTQGDIVRFQIVELGSDDSAPEEPPSVVSSEPPAPAKRKGGRPKKSG
jgi:hypothetical protein